jgi:hypothetical protein
VHASGNGDAKLSEQAMACTIFLVSAKTPCGITCRTASRPFTNSARLRHSVSSVYASATRSGSRVFHASSAAFTCTMQAGRRHVLLRFAGWAASWRLQAVKAAAGGRNTAGQSLRRCDRWIVHKHLLPRSFFRERGKWGPTRFGHVALCLPLPQEESELDKLLL